MDKWGRRAEKMSDSQTGLFPDHYLHSLLSGDQTGPSASCLISVGGYHYFCGLFHSICSFYSWYNQASLGPKMMMSVFSPLGKEN